MNNKLMIFYTTKEKKGGRYILGLLVYNKNG